MVPPPRVFLERFAYVPARHGMGTFGELSIPDRGFRCVTVEQDWEGNEPSRSCIPEGVYPLIRGHFNRGGYDTFEIDPVPGRSFIKIHRGNTLDDLQGCIAPGEALGFVSGKWAVSRSTAAFSALMLALDGIDRTTITISSAFSAGKVGLSFPA